MFASGVRLLAVVAFLASLLCVAGEAGAANRARLDDWTRDELLPYVTEQLARHPRFRGERIAIAALKDGAVAPRIDGLTASLRSTLTDALLQQQGVRLSSDGAGGAPMDCAQEGAPGYFLGLEVSGSSNGNATVSVRALDREERTFVPGFGLRWQGRLSRSESAALRTATADESLRGQRALPFDTGQTDLVAERIAGSLACDLRRRGLDTRPSAPGDSAEDGYTQGIEALVSNYLARGRLGAASEAPALSISARLHPIEGDLAQLWVTATASSDGQALPAAAAEVYLKTAPEPPADTPLLESARLVRSAASSRCSDPRAWRSRDDVRPIVSGWPTEGCVALEVETALPAYLFALVHAGKGRLRPLYPAACGRRAELEAVAGLRRFALTDLDADRGTGAKPTFYVVATSSRSDARQLERHVRELCEVVPANTAAFNRWLGDFDRLLANAQWRVVRTASVNAAERT